MALIIVHRVIREPPATVPTARPATATVTITPTVTVIRTTVITIIPTATVLIRHRQGAPVLQEAVSQVAHQEAAVEADAKIWIV